MTEPIDFPPSVIPRSKLHVKMPEGAGIPKPALLRIPARMQTVEEVLSVAGQMKLDFAVVLSQHADGGLVMLHTGLTSAEMNYLLDRMKLILLDAVEFTVDDRPKA